ncbi:MAG: ABC transporter ATP-binding protein [Enterococcus gilvus]
MLQAIDLCKTFKTKSQKAFCKETFYALKNISFSIEVGEVFAVIGESGSGKSTLGKLLLGMEEATEGKIFFNKQDISNPKAQRSMQVIFQHPDQALNPMLPIIDSVMEPLLLHDDKCVAREKAVNFLKKVGLPTDTFQSFPRKLSGGQKQRVVIARALAVQPEFIVADEPVSSLDATVQRQVINLMMDLKKEFQLTYFFISHDLLLVAEIADRIAVMHHGEIVELGTTKQILTHPQHPYTKELLSASLID